MISTAQQTSTGGKVRILGIGGSTRANSLSEKALRVALQVAGSKGATTVPATVRQLDLPLFNDDIPLEDYPHTLTWLLNEVRQADAFIFCSPTYHGTVSGAVKNALDALNFLARDTPPYLGGKPVGLMALGANSANVINSLLHTVRGLNGLSVPKVVMVPTNALDESKDEIINPTIAMRLEAMVDQTIELAGRLRV